MTKKIVGMACIVSGLVLLLALFTSNAHAENIQDQANTAAVTDTVSTVVGLAMGAAEANPLGIAAILIKIPILNWAEKLPMGERQTEQAAIASIWGGGTANNICIIAAIATGGVFSAWLCPAIGAAWGVIKWEQSYDERMFAHMCAAEQKINPLMVCTFTPA